MRSPTTPPDIQDLRTDPRTSYMFRECAELIAWVRRAIEGQDSGKGLQRIGRCWTCSADRYRLVLRKLDQLGPAIATTRYRAVTLLDGHKRTWIRAAKGLPCPSNLVDMTRTQWMLQRSAVRMEIRSQIVPRREVFTTFCRHLGDPTGESVECGGCGGGLRALFRCELYGKTLPFVRRELAARMGVHACDGCKDYQLVGGNS